jgi:hypothetical protein
LCSGNASGKYAIPTDHINITISVADLIWQSTLMIINNFIHKQC